MPSEETPKADTENGKPDHSGVRDLAGLSDEEQIRRMSEHIRKTQLETEARILARWKKRGLFGLTTSTG